MRCSCCEAQVLDSVNANDVEVRGSLMRRALLAVIGGYQRYVSPLLPSACIYSPTCSEYACQAIAKYGAVKGGWLAARRVMRCHPFHKGGYDPVP